MILLILILVYYLLVVHQNVLAQNTILWSVKSYTGKESYLLGTYHQMGNSFIDSLPEIKNALINSEVAIFESTNQKK